MIPTVSIPIRGSGLWCHSDNDFSGLGSNERLPDRSAEPGILKGKRVVIIEDEAITQLQLRKICQSGGMQVVGLASDGEQGVQKVLDSKPDLVLLDINLPLLDGLAAAEQMLEHCSACLVIITAYDGEDYQQRARDLGVSAYIIKPVTALTLLPKLEAAFQRFKQRPN